jgi:[acyl-carrier-protein] S-malonyltransferase
MAEGPLVDLKAMDHVVLFAGQGSQYVGMGAPALGTAAGRQVLSIVEEVVGLPISRLVREGPVAELSRTSVTQPCVFAISMAAVAALRDHVGTGVDAAMFAGHSLGHISALVAAGALTVEDGARLTVVRGRAMERAQEVAPGAMAALGLSADEALDLLASFDSVWLANDNAPDQVVVSGDRAQVAAVVAALSGRAKARLLPVGVAAHSPMMAEAAEEFADAVRSTTFVDARRPVAPDAGGVPTTDGSELQRDLVFHLTRAVRWQDVLAVVDQLVSCYVDAGPGQTMSGLVRRNVSAATVVAINCIQPLDEVVVARERVAS